MSIPASCPKSYSHFFLRPCIDCKHRVKSNRQRSECMSLPAVSGKCLLLYFITAAREICAFCSTTPSAMIPWGILLIVFQSDSQLTISFQNRNLPRRRKIVTCPLFSGNEKGILEDFYNSIKITRILRTDWQKWQPKKTEMCNVFSHDIILPKWWTKIYCLTIFKMNNKRTG